MNRRRLLLIGSLIALLLLSSCSRMAVIGSCSTAKVLDYGERMGLQLEKYDAQLELANSTSRINLTGPRQRLVDLRFETSEMDRPGCLAYFHYTVIEAMLLYESAFEAFASQESDQTVSNLLTRAVTEMGYVRENLLMIQVDIIPIYTD
jgi:hypothetical protein